MATTPQAQPQPQKARQFVQTQPAKRTSLRPLSADLTRSSSMGFLNQVKTLFQIGLFAYIDDLNTVANWLSSYAGQRFRQ